MSNPNWKVVASSEGYKSLKAAYVYDVQKSQQSVRRGHGVFRSKKEFRGYFKKAIGFAMEYSHKWGIPIVEVLNHWESERNYWWLNFYQRSNLDRNKPK